MHELRKREANLSLSTSEFILLRAGKLYFPDEILFPVSQTKIRQNNQGKMGLLV